MDSSMIESLKKELRKELIQRLRRDGKKIKDDPKYYKPEETVDEFIGLVGVDMRRKKFLFNQNQAIERKNAMESVRNRVGAIRSIIDELNRK
jgi:hypothetical protein